MHVGVHVLVCLAFHGEKPDPSFEVAHQNGVASDNRPENLAWKSRKENHADKERHGTLLWGEKHARAKFTQQEVHQIRARAAAGENQGDIARAFNCAQQTVSDIHRSKRWKRLEAVGM